MKNYKEALLDELVRGTMSMTLQWEDGDIPEEKFNRYLEASDHLSVLINSLFNKAIKHYGDEERGTDKFIAKQVVHHIDAYLNVTFFVIHRESEDTQRWRGDMNKILNNLRLEHKL